jgi:hypothetical protein
MFPLSCYNCRHLWANNVTMSICSRKKGNIKWTIFIPNETVPRKLQDVVEIYLLQDSDDDYFFIKVKVKR